MTVMNEATRIARESFDQTLETGAETARGVQEGFTSALENARDLNVRLIEMARANGSSPPGSNRAAHVMWEPPETCKAPKSVERNIRGTATRSRGPYVSAIGSSWRNSI
jgi:hypothetical protein